MGRVFPSFYEGFLTVFPIINCRHPPLFTPGRPNYHRRDRTSCRPLSPPPLERSHGTRILSTTSSPRDPYIDQTLWEEIATCAMTVTNERTSFTSGGGGSIFRGMWLTSEFIHPSRKSRTRHSVIVAQCWRMWISAMDLRRLESGHSRNAYSTNASRFPRPSRWSGTRHSSVCQQLTHVCVWPPVKDELLLSMLRFQSLLVLTSMTSPPYPRPQ